MIESLVIWHPLILGFYDSLKVRERNGEIKGGKFSYWSMSLTILL